jgi:hypothetical protein
MQNKTPDATLFLRIDPIKHLLEFLRNEEHTSYEQEN